MNDDERPRRTRKGYEDYLRFAGMGLTMMGIVLACAFAGWWLDRQLRWPFPVFALVMSLLGIAGAMVYLFKETRPK